MGVIKEILLNFNSFQSPQFFRFNGEPEFTNYLGGIFTILIRGVLLALIIFKLISVFGYATVYSTTNIQYNIDPNEKTVIGPSDRNSPFLVAIEAVIQHTTLNESRLDKDLAAWSFNATRHYTFLETCTRSHWAAASDEVWQELQSGLSSTSRLFCLPVGFNHVMDVSQESLFQVDFAIRCRADCLNTTATPPMYLLVRPIIYNRLINPQKSEGYIQNYLEKRRFYGVSTLDSAFDTVLDF